MMSYDESNLTIQKGYKTPFCRLGGLNFQYKALNAMVEILLHIMKNFIEFFECLV